MFLSTSGLDPILDDTLVHTNTPLSELQIRIHWLAGWVHTVHGWENADALQKQLPDFTASTAPAAIGSSAWGVSILFPHNGPMELQFLPFWGPADCSCTLRIEPRAAHVAADATLHLSWAQVRLFWVQEPIR